MHNERDMMPVRAKGTAFLEDRLEQFERRFGMASHKFFDLYCEQGEVGGVHPHLAALWAGDVEQLRRLRPGDTVRDLEAMLCGH